MKTNFYKFLLYRYLQAIAAGGLDLDLGKHVAYYDYNGFFPREFSGLKVRKLFSVHGYINYIVLTVGRCDHLLLLCRTWV